MQLSIIPLSSILVGERFRKDYGEIKDLANSIKQNGLIQPLAVYPNPEPSNPPTYILIAGGRRYEALKSLETTEVPVRIYDRQIDELELRTLELAENFYRKDLEWKEQVKLQRQIHDLQISIHGKKVSKSPDDPGWTLKDTAELVGVSAQSVQKDVQLARAVEAAPELFESAKNKSEAAKILKSVGEDMIKQEMLRRAKAAPTAQAKQNLIDNYIVGDFFAQAAKLTDETFNFAEIDPPYGIDLKNVKRDGKTEHYNEVDKNEYEDFLRRVLTESYRLMSDHSWLVLWFAPEPWFETCYDLLISTGFKTRRICGIWTKPSGQSKRPETNLANSYEMFFIASKGSPVLIKQGRSNIFNFSPVPHQHKIHPTERPLELIQELLSTFCNPGARILVPFAGSGTTLLAAQSLNMTAVGFDLSKEYKDRYIIKVHKMEEL